MASAVSRGNIAQSSEEAKLPQSFHNPNLQDHTQRLKSSADLVLTTASTVLGAGSTEGGGSQYIPTSFSEVGVPLNDAERVAIEEWAQNMDIVADEFGSTRGSSDVGGHPSNLVDQGKTYNKGRSCRELDHDLDSLVVKRSFEKAEQHWVEASYLEAEKFFRLGMNRVKKLRTSKQRSFNLDDIWLKVAFTRLHQGDFNEAEELFISLSKSKGSLEPLLKWLGTVNDPSCKTYAYFGLAQIYLCQNSSADAELMCQSCIHYWRNTPRTNFSFPYSKSLQLMAFIHEAKKDLAVATIFSEITIAEGLDSKKKTPYVIDVERFQTEIEASIDGAKRKEIKSYEKVTARILSALDYEFSSDKLSATHALVIVIAQCGGNPIGSWESGHGFVPTATDIARAIEHLCDSGADVDAVNINEYTPLMTAAERGDLAIVELLCDKGANLEIAIDKSSNGIHSLKLGIRALHLAALQGHLTVVKLLLERGALVSPQDPQNLTPLHLAAYHGCVDTVKILCDAGADLNPQTHIGETPLICVLKSGATIGKVKWVVELLCKRGANVFAMTREGRSAADLAKSKGGDLEKVLMRYSV